MLLLRRTVRFAINPGQGGEPPAGPNGYAGVPAMKGLGRHYELEVSAAGGVDAETGYFINIKAIDAAVRATVIPAIARACVAPAGDSACPARVMIGFLPALDSALGGRVAGARWWLSPYYSLEMAKTDPGCVLLRQRFEFAASHRLHSSRLTDEENRRVFGKCNLPSGHGHNYVVEPCVAVPVPQAGPLPMELTDLERIVTSTVIERFDHRHLNVDVPEFALDRGVNPSVENIAKVSYDLLKPVIAAAGGTLRHVTVWETEKTSCTYPG